MLDVFDFLQSELWSSIENDCLHLEESEVFV